MTGFCRKCGRSLDAGAGFCPACGAAVGGEGSRPAAPVGESVYGHDAAAAGMRRPDPGMYMREDRPYIDYLLMPWKRAFDFSGRSGRKEYWAFAVTNIIGYAVLLGSLVAMTISAGYRDVDPMGAAPIVILLALLSIWVLATLIPGIAIAIRRLHDVDQSGWLFLGIVVINVITGMGSVAMIVLGCIQGTFGPNQYGPDPRGGGVAEAFR